MILRKINQGAPRDIFNEVITFYVLTFCFVTPIFSSDKAFKWLFRYAEKCAAICYGVKYST